jgi:hypothetical protein
MYTYAQDFNYKGGGDGEGGGGEAMQVYWVFIDKDVCIISESWFNNTAITLQLFKIFIWFKS